MQLFRGHFRFSKMIIPYLGKGFKPHKNEAEQYFLSNHLNVDLDGFIFAFNNLISSVNHEDFLQFAGQCCDKQLALGFEDGIEYFRAANQAIEVICDPQLEEDLIIGRIHKHFYLDEDQLFYQQHPTYMQFLDAKMHLQNQMSIPNVNLQVDAYIKCRTSLKIPDQEFLPYAYHLVSFLSCRNGEPVDINFFKGFNQPEIYLSKSHYWKIVNIDKFLKYPPS